MNNWTQNEWNMWLLNGMRGYYQPSGSRFAFSPFEVHFGKVDLHLDLDDFICTFQVKRLELLNALLYVVGVLDPLADAQPLRDVVNVASRFGIEGIHDALFEKLSTSSAYASLSDDYIDLLTMTFATETGVRSSVAIRNAVAGRLLSQHE